jgi:hypothetical protein
MWKGHPMLSTKEIADYVHGGAVSAEKHHFTFSGSTKIGDALIMRWHTLADFSDGGPTLTDEIAGAAKANKAKQVLSWLRKGGLRTMSVTKRNIVLIVLFVVVFAATFVLESKRAPANSTAAFSRSNSTGVHEVVKRP